MTTLQVSRLTDAVGAEVTGLDCSGNLDEENVTELRRLWLERGLLIFRDQQLSPSQLTAFAAAFGQLEAVKTYSGLDGHPQILPLIKEPGDTLNVGEGWHADSTYLERPPTGAVLYAREVPPAGGDTLFANMYLAYQTLSSGMKRLLEGVSAVHTNGYLGDPSARRRQEGSNSMQLQVTAQERWAVHPVVQTHPETNGELLYVHQLQAAGGAPVVSHFVDMTREESAPLLDYLCRHAAREEFTGRVHWRPGTLVLYDNRCLQHNALNDYHGHRREMWRVSLAAAAA